MDLQAVIEANKKKLVVDNRRVKTPIMHNRSMQLPSMWNASGNIDPTTLGYDYTIQTVTQLAEDVVGAIYARINLPDFLDISVGFGAWMENIKINTLLRMGPSSFFAGRQSLSSGSAQLAKVNTGIVPVNVPIASWGMGFDYSIFEINKALASDNWDEISSQMEALKTIWDLGIQEVMMIGDPNDTANYPGLINNPAVTVDTTTITQNISSMSATTFQGFVSEIIGQFLQQSAYQWPDTFIMPAGDYAGLGAAASAQFPIVAMGEYLEVFKKATGNPDFKVLPNFYCDSPNNPAGLQTYVLYKRSRDVVRGYIPVQFMMNPAATQDNMHWNCAAIGQYTSPVIIMPSMVRYYTHS